MPLTKEEHAYIDLKKMILDGEFPVGDFLSQRMLASRAKTSIISLRGALRRMENDGLIENVPRWGIRIPVESEEEIRDRYFIRETLEIAAVKRICGNLSREQGKTLMAAAEKCDELTADSKEAVKGFAEAHYVLHGLIAQYSKSKLLANIMDRVFLRSSMFANAKRVWASIMVGKINTGV